MIFFSFYENDWNSFESSTSFLVSFSSTFYERIFVQNFGAKNYKALSWAWNFCRQNFVRKCMHKTLRKWTAGIIFTNKLQSQTVITLKLRKTISYKIAAYKYWWNWHQGSFSPTFWCKTKMSQCLVFGTKDAILFQQHNFVKLFYLNIFFFNLCSTLYAKKRSGTTPPIFWCQMLMPKFPQQNCVQLYKRILLEIFNIIFSSK